MVKQCKYLKDMLVCSAIKKTYNTCIAMNVIGYLEYHIVI